MFKPKPKPKSKPLIGSGQILRPYKKETDIERAWRLSGRDPKDLFRLEQDI